MKDRQIYLKHCLMYIGLDPTHNGYYQLLDCVLVRIGTRARITHIYSDVAAKYEVQPKSVMRNISYALSKVVDICDRLSTLLGFSVYDCVIHNGSVINYLADYVSEPEAFTISA